MAAFNHETNGLLESAQVVHGALRSLAERDDLPLSIRSELRELERSIGELVDRLDREAAYLIDVVGSQARRRRIRISIANRFDAAARLYRPTIDRLGIRLINEIA